MRAVVYLRISQDRTGLEAGVTRQREDCERRCSERGWDIVSVESDNDISAAGKRRRPGFQRVVELVTRGDAAVVVAWSLDRLQRNRRDELALYEACRDAGAQLSLVNGADLDFSTAAGRFVADSLGSVARLEIEMKSDRQKRAQLQTAQAGRRSGGRRPFGYDSDGVTVREGEARAVRDGYAAFLSGVPLAEIARTWNAAGHVTGQTRWKGERRGDPSPWRADSVRAVLLNPRYAGLRAHLGEVVGPAVWPALVAEETWRAAVDTLRSPDRRRKATSARALLTGVAHCGVCGSTVNAGGTTTGRPSYRCSAAYGHVGRAAAPVEEFVEAVMIGRLSRPDARRLLDDTTRPDIGALRQRAVELRTRLDGMAVEFADGVLTASQLRAATERIRGQLTETEAAMAHAGRVDLLGPLVGTAEVETTWNAMTTSRKRAVIDLLAVVTVHPPGRGVRTFRPETVGIDWRSG